MDTKQRKAIKKEIRKQVKAEVKKKVGRLKKTRKSKKGLFSSLSLPRKKKQGKRLHFESRGRESRIRLF
jgi:hypothetical protein